jgi:hypothetical protein
MDGLMSFGLCNLGARRVVATDSYFRESFELGRKALDLNVEYHPNTQIDDLVAKFGTGSFDIIICAGVIYHMLNPASAFFECRKLIKENGLVIMETAFTRRSDDAAFFVNSEEELLPEQSTYWVPTRQGVVGMMKLALFDVLAIRALHGPDRITVLGRAVGPADVTSRTGLTQRIHEVDFCDFGYLIKRDWPTAATSSTAYSGDRDERLIDQRSYQPTFPFHPPADRRTVGSTVWSTPTGNR